jgi:membrane protein DedA with SNARE-associated domain
MILADIGILQTLAGIAYQLIATLGYGGLAIGLIIDSAGVPIPSEILIPLAAAAAYEGRLNIVAVFIVGTFAQTLGAILAYYLGAKGGLPLAEKYGKYVFFSRQELATTQRWFNKYGAWLTFFGRCLPVIRTYIGFPAGAAQMHVGRFVLASLVGSAMWTGFLAYLGYNLAGQLEAIDRVLQRFSLLVVGLLAVGLIWYVKRHQLAKRPKD